MTSSAKISLRNCWYLVLFNEAVNCRCWNSQTKKKAEMGLNLMYSEQNHYLHKIKLIFRTPLSEKRSLFSSELHCTEVLALLITSFVLQGFASPRNPELHAELWGVFRSPSPSQAQAGLGSELDWADRGLVQSSTAVFQVTPVGVNLNKHFVSFTQDSLCGF